MTRALLDTSVLNTGWADDETEFAISAASLGEVHFGALVARDRDLRSRRMQRLAEVEASFSPLPLDALVEREWGRLAAAVQERGGRPRRRAMDLAIAATANVARVPLLTEKVADLRIIDDLVDVRRP